MAETGASGEEGATPAETGESTNPEERPELEKWSTKLTNRSKTTEDSIAIFMQDRRKYEGGNDGEDDDRDPAQIPRSELLKRAQVHMLSTACTEWDEEEKCYKFRSVWKTTRRELGIIGVGVQLYFQFLCQMGCVFLFLTILTLPMLLTSTLGDLVTGEGSQKVFGMMSIANLGICSSNFTLCRTAAEMEYRKAGFQVNFLVSEETRVRDVTSLFGTLDGVALLVFMSFGLFFAKFWIPRELRIHDGVHHTAGDFSLLVKHLPRELLGDEHKDYAKLLKEHFAKILRERCGVQDDQPVHEVVPVRDYNGAIDNYIVQGQYLLEKKDLQVKMKTQQSEEKKQNVQKRIDYINKKIVKMESSFGANAGKSHQDRKVMGQAFVTFNQDTYVDKILYEYRFARSRIFRCCLPEPLRFYGSRISVDVAPEPSDLFWENMDYHRYRRRVRLVITCLMTLVILVASLIMLLYCKMIGVTTGATAPSADLWVVKSTQDTDCLTLCNWTLYSDDSCLQEVNSTVVSYWDPTGSLLMSNDTTPATCSNGGNGAWRSPACLGPFSPLGTPAQVQWVGVQFSTPVSTACMRFQQGANNALNKAELYACSSSPLANLTSSQLSAWTPAEHCIGMQDLEPHTAYSGAWSDSGRLMPLVDTSCARTVSYEAAEGALQSKMLELKVADPGITDEHANYMASATDPTMDCYCKQQQSILGFASFRFGTHDTPAELLCAEWIYYQNVQITMMSVGALLVCVLNLVLVLIFSYFVIWEKHSTFSSQNSSQFLKLFFAQFMNTALLVLLVNANFRKTMDDVWVVTVFGFGKGAYDDFNRGWFVQVGSQFVLSVFLQVITATTPGIVMSFIVNPLLIMFFRWGLATQRILNQVYVFPEWSMANRLAQTMTVFFVILMYSGGMPILNFVGCLYCLVAYWMDKWCLLRGSVKPPAYSGNLLRIAANMFPIAAFLHALVTLWCYGNQDIFPSDWSVLKNFYGGIIDMTESEYSEIVDRFNRASEAERDSMFWHFVHARALDMARWSSWLLLCIFLVFCAYYIINLVHTLFLGPILAPVYIYITGKCHRGVDANPQETVDYIEKHKEMLDKGLLLSYVMQENPRYEAVLEHLNDGGKEVEIAKGELAESEAAAAAAREAAAAAKEAAAAAKAAPNAGAEANDIGSV